MTAPIQPQRFDREGAKRAGYSDAEIDEFLTAETKAKRPDVASFKETGDGRRERFRPDNLVRQAMNGITFGLNDELSGAADAVVRKVGGDQRPIGDLYRTARDEVRAKSKEYADENPGTALAAQTAGALASGRFVPNISVGSGLTAGSRVAGGAVNGAVQGAASGVGNANGSLADRVKGGAAGGIAGGVGGGVLAGATELLRAGGRVAGGARAAYQGRNGAPIAMDADQAARETIPILERSGKSIADLRAADAVADAPDNLAELIDGEFGKAARDQLGTTHRYGLRPKVEETLVERSRGEAGRARRALERNGVVRQNGKVLEAEKLAEAQSKAGPLYEEAFAGRTVTDPKLLDLVERPSGGKAYNEARTHMLDRGEDMPDLSGMVAKSKPVDLPEPVTRSSGDAVPSLEELAGMSKDQLRKYRSSKPVEKMTDRELAFENHYLDLLHGEDQAAATFRDLPVHAERDGMGHSSKSKYMREDWQGVLPEHGFNDPDEFRAMNFDAGNAERRSTQRAPRMKSVKSELEARGQGGFAEPSNAGPKSEYTIPDGGEIPSIPAKQVQRVKLALDDRLKDLEGKSGGTSTQRYRDLIGLRDEFDNLLYEHAPGYDKAQAAYAKPMQERDAFMEGRRASSTMDETDVDRLLSAKSPEYVAKGVASGIHRDLSRLNDGTKGGSIQNPANTLIGNERARAKLAVATQKDPAKLADITKAAQGINRRFGTANKALAGSPSAERIAADIQDMGGQALTSVAQGKFGAALDAIIKPVNQAARGASLDRRSSLLLAMGGDRAKAIDLLEKARPVLIRQAEKEAGRAGLTGRVAGGVTGRAVGSN